MKRRNIAVFFDGTGQCRDYQPSYNWTNVTFLYDAVDVRESDELVQTRKYLDGVGTREGESLEGGGFGIGLDKRIEEACSFLYQEFDIAFRKNQEPHVYLFGFSRGAFAARWLASLLEFVGVSKGNPAPRKLFSVHKDQDVSTARSYIESRDVWYPVKIDFMGLWDTVEASVDEIRGIEKLPSCVEAAYHALAIDEWRSTFKPTRFAKSDRVTEVWFPGCHSDVGGGYEIRTLANAPLDWMVEGCQKYGLAVDENALQEELRKIKEMGVFHDELEHSILWRGLNLHDGYKGRYFRDIPSGDYIDASVARYGDTAPTDRRILLDKCVVVNERTGNAIDNLC